MSYFRLFTTILSSLALVLSGMVLNGKEYTKPDLGPTAEESVKSTKLKTMKIEREFVDPSLGKKIQSVDNPEAKIAKDNNSELEQMRSKDLNLNRMTQSFVSNSMDMFQQWQKSLEVLQAAYPENNFDSLAEQIDGYMTGLDKIFKELQQQEIEIQNHDYEVDGYFPRETYSNFLQDVIDMSSTLETELSDVDVQIEEKSYANQVEESVINYEEKAKQLTEGNPEVELNPESTAVNEGNNNEDVILVETTVETVEEVNNQVNNQNDLNQDISVFETIHEKEMEMEMEMEEPIDEDDLFGDECPDGEC